MRRRTERHGKSRHVARVEIRCREGDVRDDGQAIVAMCARPRHDAADERRDCLGLANLYILSDLTFVLKETMGTKGPVESHEK